MVRHAHPTAPARSLRAPCPTSPVVPGLRGTPLPPAGKGYPMTANGWLTVHDLAPILGVTTRTVHRWAAERRIPHVRIGRSVRFTPAQVDEIAAAYTVEPIAEPIETSQANPRYQPNRAVVVPMRRDLGA